MAHEHAHHVPGEPPPIHDEAADSPLWLPAVGLVILLLGAILMIWRGATDDETAAALAGEVVEADGEAGGEGEAAEGDAPAAAGHGGDGHGHDGHDHDGHDHAH
ncbi:MAG: hypothetical protein KF729_16670 [Sandaracinaceae bacterium]|nr:hypothetical protein [Sandaracinaceae bacterium]